MRRSCLSLPFVSVNRKRAKVCVVKAKDIEGKEFTLETKGLLAVVVQHEFGHISAGELIIDAMDASDAVVNKRPLELLALFEKKQKEEALKKEVQQQEG